LNHTLRALSGAAAALLLIVASAPKPAAADDALTVITGAFPTAFYEVIGDVAQGAGFYKEQHLAVTVQYAGNPSVAIQALASGKGDVGSVALEPVIQGYEKGLRMVAIISRNPALGQTLGVLDDSPIHALADFKGTTIGELSLGQPGEVITKALLAGAGLKPSDYAFAPIGNGAQAIQALTSHKVAGAAFPSPELRIYEVQANLKFRYFSDPLLKDISDVAYVASPATIAAKGDLLKRFARATVEAAILIRENPALAAKYFVEGSGVKETPEAIATNLRLLSISQSMLLGVDPTSKRIGYMPVRGLGVLTKFMYDNGLTTTLVPAQAIVTNQFIEYANDFNHGAFIGKVKAMK
jgi:ABC-type nitrate/sulfonate/bicarbonate transport system substrate-binding protein